MGRVIVFGSANMDTVVNVDRFPQPGETIHASASSTGGGGKGLNQAVAASRMGAQTFMVGAVGSDAAGQTLVTALAEEAKLGLEYLRFVDGPTGQAFVTVDHTGENHIVIVTGANETHTPRSVPSQLGFAEPDDVLLCQLEIPRPATAAALAYAHERGVFTILNAAPAAPVADMLNSVSLLIVNETEAVEILNEPEATYDSFELAQVLYERTGVDVVVTLGARGLVFDTFDGSGSVPPYPVTSIDSTGAGDAFVGATATFLAEGKSLKQALELAAILGALVCTSTGAQGYGQRLEDVLELAATQ